MRLLFALAVRSLRTRPLRTLLMVVGVGLGTSAVTAALTANAAIEASLAATALALTGKADLLVEALGPEGFPDRNMGIVRSLPEVADVVPRVEKRTFFRTASQRGFVELRGVEPEADARAFSYKLVAGQSLSIEPGSDVLVQDSWAVRFGVKPGETITLLTTGGFANYVVRGVIAETDPGLAGSGSLFRTHLAVAQSAFGLDGRLHALLIKLREPQQAPELEGRLRSRLEGEFALRRGSDVVRDLERSQADLGGMLLFFAGVALFAGAFLVYNIFSMILAEQAGEFRLLRASGATEGQVAALALIQAAMVALLGVVAGVVFGALLAQVLVWWLESTRGLAPVGFVVSPAAAGLGAVTGLVMSALAVLAPAARSGRFQAARTPGAEDGEQDGQRPWRALGLVGAAVLAAFLLAAPPELRPLKLLALPLMLLLLVYGSPLLATPFIGLAGVLVRGGLGAVGSMAHRNVERNQAHTGPTIAGFFVSLTFLVALSNAVGSVSGVGQERVRSLFPGDYLVVAPVPQPLIIANEFVGLPGAARTSPAVFQRLRWEDKAVTAVGVDPDYYSSAFQFLDGDRASAFAALGQGGAVLVTGRMARTAGITVGSVLSLRGAAGVQPFRVAGIIRQSFPSSDNYGALVISAEDARRHFSAQSFQFIGLSALPGADRGELLESLRQRAELYGLEANTVENLQQAVREAMERLLALFLVLLAIGLVIGALGIFTTMMMNVSQRARELAVLRVGGMTRGQIQLLITTEGAILGFLSAVLGIIVGFLVTLVLLEIGRTPEFDPTFSFSPGIAAAALVIGTFGAVLSALYPAYRAASLNIVSSLQE